MKLHHIPIAIIILAFVTIGLTAFITELGENYGQEADLTTLNQLSSNFEGIKNSSEELKGVVDDFIPEKDEAGQYLLLPYNFLRTGWKIIVLMWESVVTLGGVSEIISTSLVEQGIPMSAEIITLLVVVITITIVAIIAYGLGKWKYDDR